MEARGRDEQKEAGKQLDQLLQELRVALPGVQMLFGFLLTVPFNERFQRLDVFARDVFYAVFTSTTLASVALIAPSAFHRIHKGRNVRALLGFANRSALSGLAFLGLSISGCAYLITTVVFGPGAARIAVACVATVIAFAWLVLPLASRVRDREHERPSVA
jgi:hypothetical protein